jgi:hypothetical protein
LSTLKIYGNGNNISTVTQIHGCKYQTKSGLVSLLVGAILNGVLGGVARTGWNCKHKMG